MKVEAYSETPRSDLILRDHLAASRTVLANERTILAYVRTALSLVVTGMVFLKLARDSFLEWLGWPLLAVGLVVLVVGLVRHREMAKAIGAAVAESDLGDEES